MPIRRRRADAGKARGLGESKSRRPFSGDQFQRGADQRLAQIPVMIAARRVALARIILAPTHVKDTYIRPAEKSMFPGSPPGSSLGAARKARGERLEPRPKLIEARGQGLGALFGGV